MFLNLTTVTVAALCQQCKAAAAVKQFTETNLNMMQDTNLCVVPQFSFVTQGNNVAIVSKGNRKLMTKMLLAAVTEADVDGGIEPAEKFPVTAMSCDVLDQSQEFSK